MYLFLIIFCLALYLSFILYYLITYFIEIRRYKILLEKGYTGSLGIFKLLNEHRIEDALILTKFSSPEQ